MIKTTYFAFGIAFVGTVFTMHESPTRHQRLDRNSIKIIADLCAPTPEIDANIKSLADTDYMLSTHSMSVIQNSCSPSRFSLHAFAQKQNKPYSLSAHYVKNEHGEWEKENTRIKLIIPNDHRRLLKSTMPNIFVFENSHDENGILTISLKRHDKTSFVTIYNDDQASVSSVYEDKRVPGITRTLVCTQNKDTSLSVRLRHDTTALRSAIDQAVNSPTH